MSPNKPALLTKNNPLGITSQSSDQEVALELLKKVEADYRGLARAALASNIKLPRTAADELETANHIKGFLTRAALAPVASS